MQRLGHLLGRHVLEHLVADRLVEFRQRSGLEVVAQCRDEARALIGTEQLDQVGEIGRVQFEGERPYPRHIAVVERGGDGMQEIGTDVPVLVAQFNLAYGVLHRPSNRWVFKLRAGMSTLPRAAPALSRLATCRFRPVISGQPRHAYGA